MTGTPTTILVTDARRGSAIAVMRALGRRGYRVVAVDSDPESLGFRSRYVKRALCAPSAETHAADFLDFLRRAVQEEHVDLVIPVTDFVLQPLIEHRSDFTGLCRLAIPGADAYATVSNKAQTLELAKRLEVPVPGCHRVETAAEAARASGDLGWPIVLKPEASHAFPLGSEALSFKVTYAESPSDLETKMRAFEGRCAVLLQQYISGVGHGVELLMSQGRPLAAFQHKRLREIPLTGGASTYRESHALDPRMLQHSIALLGAISWTGLAMVEFKLGAKGPALMEINGRIWGSIPLAIASGMDFATGLARLFLEGDQIFPAELQHDYKIGVRCRDLPRDLMWIAAILGQKRRHRFLPLPSRRDGVRALLGLFNPSYKQDLLVWDDPLPGLMQLPRILPRFLDKAKVARQADA